MNPHMSMSKRLVVAVATVACTATLVASTAGDAFAYNTFYPNECNGGARWLDSYLPSPWRLNENGYSPMQFSSLQTLLQNAWDEWDEPCCTKWNDNYQGTTSNTALSNSSQNVLSFSETSWPSEYGDVNGTIAVTTPGIYQDCSIRGADMIFNGVGFNFIDGAPTNVFNNDADLYSIAVHEMGHWLGLDHSSVMQSSLWWSYSGTDAERTLHQDDIDAVCFLYTQSCSCSSDNDCPAGEACMGGACVEPPCTSDNDCTSPLVCNTGTGQCVTPPCSSDSDCGPGFTCNNNLCVASGTCRTCQSCTQNSDCGANGFCADFGNGIGQCTYGCSQSSPCPGDSECFQLSDGQGNTYNLCLNPDADTAGLCPASYTCGGGGGGGCNGLGNDCSNNGAACTADNDVCLDDGTQVFCSCSCSNNADCGTGNTCETLSDGSRACVEGSAPTGDCGGQTCAANEVCNPANNQCISDQGCPGLGNACDQTGSLCTEANDVCLTEDGASYFCSCICQSNADCGAGNECVDLGNGQRGCVESSGPSDPCDGVTCPSGQTCNPATGTCEGQMVMDDPPADTSMPTDTAVATDTSMPADTTGATDTSTGADTSSPADTSAPGADAGADTTLLPTGPTPGTQDGGCCTTVRTTPERETPWAPLGFGLALGLLGLARVRRRR